MKELILNYIGCDSWDRPVYESSEGHLYVDTDPRKSRNGDICTKYNNEFEGEPDSPINYKYEKITFVPKRVTW